MPRFTRILTNRDEIERNWDVGTILWPTMRRDDKAYFERFFLDGYNFRLHGYPFVFQEFCLSFD